MAKKNGAGETAAAAAPAKKLVQLQHSGILLDRKWVAGELYELEAWLADKLLGMKLQRGMHVYDAAVPATDEAYLAKLEAEAAAAKAKAEAEAAKVMEPVVPERSVLEQMRLEQLRELAAAKGIKDANVSSQQTLIDALAPVAANDQPPADQPPVDPPGGSGGGDGSANSAPEGGAAQ